MPRQHIHDDPCGSAPMDADQDAARRFVKEILQITGWTPTRLAREAAISHTTISRFLNNENVTHTLSTRTISKIRAAASREIAPKLFDAHPKAEPRSASLVVAIARDTLGLLLCGVCGACAVVLVAWMVVLL